MTKMKDSGIDWIGEIPEGWGVKKLSQLFSEHKLKNIGNTEQNLLSLSYGSIVRKSIKSSVGLLPESFETYNVIDRGDIVLRLTDLQNDKRSLRTGLASERGIITSAYLTIRLVEKTDSAKYYHYLLHTYDKCKVFYNFGGGVRQGGTWDDISGLKIIVPDQEEQTKIANYLDIKVAQLDRAKALLEEQIATMQDYLQSLIYDTVTKGLDKTIPMKDSGVDWIGQIPEGWKVKRLKYVFETIGSGTTPDSSKSDYYDGDINWLQSGDLYKADYVEKVSKTITELGYRNSASLKIYQAPFIALAMYGASIGNLAISKIDACVNQAVVVLKDDEQLVRFTKYALECSKEELVFAAQGGTQPNINQVLIKNWQIPLPSATELKEIADFLDTKTAQINQMIAIKQEQIDNINQQRQTLIYDVVTGKRRV